MRLIPCKVLLEKFLRAIKRTTQVGFETCSHDRYPGQLYAPPTVHQPIGLLGSQAAPGGMSYSFSITQSLESVGLTIHKISLDREGDASSHSIAKHFQPFKEIPGKSM